MHGDRLETGPAACVSVRANARDKTTSLLLSRECKPSRLRASRAFSFSLLPFLSNPTDRATRERRADDDNAAAPSPHRSDPFRARARGTRAKDPTDPPKADIPTLKAAQQDDPEDQRQLTAHPSGGIFSRRNRDTLPFTKRYLRARTAARNPRAPRMIILFAGPPRRRSRRT